MCFSYERKNNFRVNYLNEMLHCIYGTTNINFKNEEGQEFVESGNSIFSLCKFEKRKSMGLFCERFRELLEYTLLNDNFKFKIPRKKIKLDTDNALNNTQSYLQNIGVDFSEYNGVGIKKERWRWMLYTAMVLYVIPAIFFVEYKDRNNNLYNDTYKDDDIGFQVRAAVAGVQAMLDREIMFIHSYNKITKVYDKKFKCDKYNYKLPIEISAVDPPHIINWKDISVDIKCNNAKKIEQHENILDGFIKINPQKEIITTISCPSINKSKYTVSISNVSYEAKDTFSNNLEYYTYIEDNDDNLRKIYKNNAELKKKVKGEAEEDIRNMFRAKVEEYYTSITHYIEEALERISKIDVQLFIRENNDISKYKEALSLFTPQADEIVSAYIKNNGNELCKKMVKDTLINLISKFKDQLEYIGEQLTEKYMGVLTDKSIADHKDFVGKCLKNTQYTKISESYKKIHSELEIIESLYSIAQHYYDLL